MLVATALMSIWRTLVVGTPMSSSTGKTFAGVELDGAYATVSSAAWMEPPVKVKRPGLPPTGSYTPGRNVSMAASMS